MGLMARGVPYDTSAEALLNPARNALLFEGWEPAVDNQNQDLLCAEMSRLAYADREIVSLALAGLGFSVGILLTGLRFEARKIFLPGGLHGVLSGDDIAGSQPGWQACVVFRMVRVH
jgi:hypothetical protein